MTALLPILARIWPYLAGVALILGAWAWADHRGYARGKHECEARVAAAAERIRVATERTNRVLAATLEERDAATAARAIEVQTTGERAASIIIREISSDPRLSAPDCSVPAGVLDAINSARRGAD